MRLANIFTDHCVLQRDKSITVWGWTGELRSRVVGTLNGIRSEGVSGDDKRFLLRFPGMPAGGPYSLRVEDLDAGESVELSDVLIGDVWLASGQSNMEWTIAACEYGDDIKAATPDQIRMIKIANRAHLAPQTDVAVHDGWELSTPKTKGEFSAVANFFAQRLQDETGVPVGIISSNWGGSMIETWISRQKLISNSRMRDWVHRYETDSWSADHWDFNRESFFPRDPGNTGLEKGWAEKGFDDASWDFMPDAGTWQSQEYDHTGVFWFRKKVSIPESALGKDLELSFCGLNKHDITYVNGEVVGQTGKDFECHHAQAPRFYKVPGKLVTDTELQIAIRMYSFVFLGGFTGDTSLMQLTLDDGNCIALDTDWRFICEHNLGVVEIPARMGHDSHNSPYMCYENMIRPITDIGLKGVIWYQGESNATTQKALYYHELMCDLINDWRFRFADPELPFIQVQLANFKKGSAYQETSAWAVLRDQQRLVTKSLDHNGMAVIIDVGDAVDIHPKDKKTVGNRLAQWALAKVYHQKSVAGSPLYTHMAIKGDKLQLFFEDVGECLKTSNGKAPAGFYVSDDSRTFKAAHAEIDGCTVLVSHPDVKHPVAVRYAWADNPTDLNLVNEIDFPVSPFRTDNWYIANLV